jgi:hypothetical protein
VRDDYFINKPKPVVCLGQGKFLSDGQFVYLDSTVFWNMSLVVTLRCVSSTLHSITYQHILDRQIEPPISVIRDGLFFYLCRAKSRPRSPHRRGFEITHTHTHTHKPHTVELLWTSDRPVAEATHNTHKRQTSMPPVGFKPTIPASER